MNIDKCVWMIYTLLTLVVFGSVGIAGAAAQDFSILEYELLTVSEIEEPATPNQDSLEVIINHFHFYGAFPLIQREDFRVLSGIAYDWWTFDFNNYRLQTRRPDHLHYLRYQLGIVKGLANGWSLTAVFAPGIASDLDSGITGDDWRLQGMTMITKTVHEDLKYGFGAAITNDFGSPALVPVVNLSWKTESDFRISGLLPRNFGIWFVPGEQSEIGLRASITGSKFHLNEADPLRGADIDVKYSVLTVGPEVKKRIAGPFFLRLEGGYTLFRTFRFEGPGGENDLDLENNIFLRAGVVFRPDFVKY